MSDSEDDDDKQHEASQQKLDQARKDGDIARSTDLQTAVTTGGFLLALFSFGTWSVTEAGSAGMTMLDQSDSLSRLVASGSGGAVWGLAWGVAAPPIALLLMSPILVIGLLVASRGLVFAPKKLAPQMSRISPLSVAKQKFGIEGFVEFGKSTAKMILVSVILYFVVTDRLEDILASLYLSPGLAASLMAWLVLKFLFILFLIQLALGGADFVWQIYHHRQKLRMSRKEMMDEFKESEGDPHLKAARRQRAQEVATNRMLTDVASADVVVVNPTHYAVALKWDRKKGGAPLCVAKGVDEVARKIRERAAEHGVPIHSDPPTARAIHATVEIGQEIRLEHYRAIAAAIRFADAMRRKARRR